MHSLQGTFVKELPEEVLPSLGVSLWPLKIILLPTMSRILYFRNVWFMDALDHFQDIDYLSIKKES